MTATARALPAVDQHTRAVRTINAVADMLAEDGRIPRAFTEGMKSSAPVAAAIGVALATTEENDG